VNVNRGHETSLLRKYWCDSVLTPNANRNCVRLLQTSVFRALMRMPRRTALATSIFLRSGSRDYLATLIVVLTTGSVSCPIDCPAITDTIRVRPPVPHASVVCALLKTYRIHGIFYNQFLQEGYLL